MTRLLLLLVATLACMASPALATPMPVDLPIPRFYDSGPGNQRADPNKPDDLRAREAAQADAFETACNAQTGPDKWAACADLGRAYHLGEGRPQNRPVAELLYRRACNAGSGAGCYGLGTLLESVNEENEVRLASQYFARACQLGMLNGCDKQADGLAEGSFFDPDPQAAETLRRATCDRGGRAACIAVAGLLLRQDRTSAEQDEGRALLDRQCRSGDPVACRDAAAHWQRLIMPDAGARYIEYLALGCDAGDPALCRDRGRTELPYYDISDAAQFVPAQRFFDRACALDDYYCKSADMLRDVPQISTKCDAGDQPSCLALGLMLVQGDSPIRDDTRALALLGPQCDAGANAACLPAANLVIEQWRTNNIPDPVRLDAFLRRSCASGERSACEVLANILARGDLLEQDTTGAAVLYVDICENSYFFDQACDFLEELARNDPAAPLTLAKADYVPEPTPEEIAEAAEQERLENEKRLREIEEEFARACTTTTVIFEGQSYTDKLCTSVVRVVNGFAARVGEAPWQALLWRPEKLSRKLTLAERVKCGGAVIRDGWILTAAHCLTDDGGVSITTAGHRVRLGLNNPLSDEGYSYRIIRAIPHPDFKRKPLAFDIALVQYDTARGERGGGKVMPPRRIRLDPLLLDQRKLSAVQRVVTYGWGETKVDTGLVPDHLRGARLKLRSTDACTADTRFEDDKRRDSLICADDTKAAEGGQACSGDSGGPLITYGDADSVPTVIGVVSGGVECGTSAEGRPSRYTRIAHPLIRAWLRSHVPGFGLR